MFKSKLFWLFAAVVFAAFLRVGLREKTPPQPQAQAVARPAEDPSKGVRGAGYMAAKKVLPRALKHPEEAEYPWDSVATEKQADGTWLVTGAVIAKNSFGVRDRLVYGITIVEAGENLNAVKVVLPLYNHTRREPLEPLAIVRNPLDYGHHHRIYRPPQASPRQA